MAVIMTYNSLLAQLQSWNERINDTILATEIPEIISQTEIMLACELKTLIFQRAITSNFLAGPTGNVIPKPSRWRENSVFTYGNSAGQITELYPRKYSYCRKYAPDPTVLGPPKYYTDYQWGYFLIVPSPDQAYPFELVYFESAPPLGPSQQMNQITEFVPHLLFKACQLNAVRYLRNTDLIQLHQDDYDRALTAVKEEGISRQQDAGQDAEAGT